MTALLDLQEVDVALGGMPVVSGVSLQVRAGEMVALLGRNGAGKSTTLRAVAGLERVAAGRVLLDGRQVQNRHPHQVAAAGCSLVLEGARVFRLLSVEDNLRLGAYGAGRAETARRLEQQYGRFPALAARAAVLAGQLSGGEQALLALAQGLMAAPRVLLLDEPAVGLDVGMAAELMRVLAAVRDRGCAVLMAEQSVERALAVVDRACVLDLGRVVTGGTAEEVRRAPALREAYLGRAAGSP